MVVYLTGDQVVLFMQNLGYYVKFCYIYSQRLERRVYKSWAVIWSLMLVMALSVSSYMPQVSSFSCLYLLLPCHLLCGS